ncbi:MAG: type II secretion system F family protein [Candidatus Doudnabacteria bacterium]|nr:type II secretion system F family protein [Candidatus Doudnabacteria bacterium]
MEFSYQARDNQGALKTGTVEAGTMSSAQEILHAHGLIVIKVLPVSSISFLDKINFLDRISPKEVVMFSRQMATLINAKVPIVMSLKILQGQVNSRRLSKIVGEIASKVEAGNALSAAIVGYPKLFNEMYVNLVHSGEMSGSLDDSLVYLADQVEKDYDLRSKIIGAMTYPAFILAALVIVGFLMFIFVLPPMISLLQESNVELPFTTKILVFVTKVLQNYWYLVGAGLIGGIFGFRFYVTTTPGKYLFDLFRIKVPIFGKLAVNIYMSRFTRNLSTLISGGIPIVKAMDSVADIVGNVVYRDMLFEAATDVKNGKGIAQAISDRTNFPPIISQMMQIGESTGKLHEILDKIARFYEKEVEGMLKTLTTLIEPIIMMLLGLAVAVMVAGILLPIYNLAGAV